ncbi:small ribosomal subunit protein mS23-like [Saccostrea echinata]|uniref:small ribosomal subunit protein mS23-like n=1 Tax=Saccostrea echinata TaxID=191078 RepID=UPI002A8243A3|nr:small ribosomal subunit protein mS23-like [Saccostrea echinata]
MASSRGQFLGTIYKRTQGLIRSGALRREKIPIWYNVYEAFPPLDTFDAERKEPDISSKIRRINYPEDLIRIKFYDEYSTPEVVNLDSNVDTLSQKFAKCYLAKKSSMLKQSLEELSESSPKEDRVDNPVKDRLEPPLEDRKVSQPMESDVSFEEILRVFAHDHNLKMKEEDLRRQRKLKQRESIQMRELKRPKKPYRSEAIVGTWDQVEKL